MKNDSSRPHGAGDFSIPRWFKPGLLPRTTKVGSVCPLLRDHCPIIPRAEWPHLIPRVVNDPLLGWFTFNQGNAGSCASEAATATVSGSRELQGQPRVELNPYFVYGRINGGSDRGSSIDDNLRFIREYGIASTAVWPRSRGWRTKPTEEAYADALHYRLDEFYEVTNWDEFGSAIFFGFLVEFGYNPGGGHAVVGTSLLSLQRLRFKNSWGAWGDNGFGELDANAIDWRYGAFAARVPVFGQSV